MVPKRPHNAVTSLLRGWWCEAVCQGVVTRVASRRRGRGSWWSGRLRRRRRRRRRRRSPRPSVARRVSLADPLRPRYVLGDGAVDLATPQQMAVAAGPTISATVGALSRRPRTPFASRVGVSRGGFREFDRAVNGDRAVGRSKDVASLPDVSHGVSRSGPVRERRPVYVDLLPPCNAGCPARENIQAWLAHTTAGHPEQAWRETDREQSVPGHS